MTHRTERIRETYKYDSTSYAGDIEYLLKVYDEAVVDVRLLGNALHGALDYVTDFGAMTKREYQQIMTAREALGVMKKYEEGNGHL